MPFLVVLAMTLAAPVPKPRPVVYYFPTTVGDTWAIQHPGKPLATHTVAAVERADGGLVVTVKKEDGLPHKANSLSRYQVRVTDDSVDFLPTHGGPLAKPSPHLKLLPDPSRGWKSDHGRRVASGPTEVEVGAGRFTAVRVDERSDAGKAVISEWYAPRVGLVKASYADKKGLSDVVIEMTSFSSVDGTLPNK